MNDPKFQYSVFAGDNRNEQYVVRADTITELNQQISDLRNFLKNGVEKPVPAAVPDLPLGSNTVPCKECNQPMSYREGVSRSTGKLWKGYFCKNRDHKPWFIKD